ncbi:MAG: peroxiredoxin [Lacunisphaera sp.]
MKVTRLFILLIAAMSFLTQSNAKSLKAGDDAPAVSGVTETGAKLDFADVYKNGYTLVYFYPKADTPGCTKQGCSLRDSYVELTKRGVTVIGVSHDDVAAQKAFKEKYSLPFTLVADTDNAVMKAFEVPTIPMTSLATRQAYLIDKHGKIVWADYKAATEKQAQDVLAELTKLGA